MPDRGGAGSAAAAGASSAGSREIRNGAGAAETTASMVEPGTGADTGAATGFFLCERGAGSLHPGNEAFFSRGRFLSEAALTVHAPRCAAAARE